MSKLKEDLRTCKEILEGEHKYLVHAWIGGATIQKFVSCAAVQLRMGNEWVDVDNPMWLDTRKYRVKPKFIC